MPKTKKKPIEDTTLLSAGNIIGFIVIILVVIFAANLYTKRSVSKDQLEIEQRAQLLQNKLTQLENEVYELRENTADAQAELDEIPDFIYRVEETADGDSKITRTAVKEGREEMLVDSILTLAEIDSPTIELIEQSIFPTKGLIFFRQVASGSGADEIVSALNFWKFDANAMTIEPVVRLQNFDGNLLNLIWADSPELTKIAYIDGDDAGDDSGLATTVYVYNFLTEELDTVLTLSENQTFNAQSSYPLVSGDLTWKDEHTIIVSIYDQESDTEEGDKALIEQKEIVIE